MPNTNPQNLRLTTGRLFWLPDGETGYIDLGNCTSHMQKPEVKRVEHYKYSGGIKRVDHSRVSSLKPVRVFTFDEHFAETLRLQTMANQLADVVQNAASAQTILFTEVDNYPLNHCLPLGKLAVKNVTGLSGSSETLVEGRDFALDKPSGMITLLSFTGVVQLDWTFTFDCEAVTQLNFVAFSRLLETGTFKFVEVDQIDPVPVNTEALSGTVYVTGWGDGTSEKFQEFTVEVLSL